MKLKTLLMGSAASLIAVSGAYAADAVVAEPEPMDYVKVCDMYGAGFFYIPGTETCLKISGYVDVQYEYSQIDNKVAVESGSEGSSSWDAGEFSDSYSIGEPVYLARVNFDAREETDYGTLQSYIRMEGSGDHTGGGGLKALDVYISLGGFSMGYRTTALETGGLPGVMLDGYYGGGRHMYANYTFAANGFAVTAGVDLDNGQDLTGASVESYDFSFADGPEATLLDWGWSMSYSASGKGGDGESVNPYVVASYTGSMFTIRGKYGHDTSASESFYGVDGSVTPLDGLTIRGFWEASSGVNEYAFNADPTGFYRGTFGVGEDGGDSSIDLYAEQNWGIGASYALMDN